MSNQQNDILYENMQEYREALIEKIASNLKGLRLIIEAPYMSEEEIKEMVIEELTKITA